jgi:glucose/arabinose dehydrogenase
VVERGIRNGEGLAVAPDGTLYVSDDTAGAIYRLSPAA